MVRVSGMAQSC
uniref:Uncharacterized protein n=1 Tax=Anguilla anguilla TaxID=7936 RepID=A0A0E9SG58_ANGAN